jgi:nucleolar protein 53
MRKRPGDGNTTDGIIPAKRQRTSYVSHKELTRLRNIADGRHGDAVVDVTEASYDPWDGQKDIEESTLDPRFSFLEKSKKKVAPRTLKQKPISLAASGKDIPAVKKPDGGYSYNPINKDYEERLTTEGGKELAAEEKRLEAAEAERIKLEAATKSAAEAEAADARAEVRSILTHSTSSMANGSPDVRMGRRFSMGRNRKRD